MAVPDLSQVLEKNERLKAEENTRNNQRNDLTALVRSLDANQQALIHAFKILIQYMDGKTTKTEVVNHLKEIGTPDVMRVVKAVRELDGTLKKRPQTDLSPVVAQLKLAVAELQKKPSEFPKFPDFPKSFEVNNLKGIREDIQSVSKAVKNQKTTFDPKITVKPSDVILDLKPLETLISGVRESIENKEPVRVEQVNLDLQPILDSDWETRKLLKELVDKPVPIPPSMPREMRISNLDEIPAASSDGLTDAELRASPVTVTVDNFPSPDEAGLTDAELRATPVEVDTGLTVQTDALTDTELRATPVGVVDANKQDTLYYAKVRSASDTITPSAGKRIKLVKAQILQSPDNETYNLVTLSFVSTGDFFTCWAGSDSTEVIGDTDEDLTITLANANPVSVNIRYKEIT